jgi:hypothetical protein
MPRRSSVLAAALLLFTAAPVLAASPQARPDPERAEHERIVKHWTAERLQAATPRDFVRTAWRSVAAGAAGDQGTIVFDVALFAAE